MKEIDRKTAVQRLGVLQQEADEKLDRFVELASSAFECPIAALTIISGGSLYMKVARGIEGVSIDRRQSFCNRALEVPDLLECCDALEDKRFQQLPLVIEAPFVRYYIGAPLRLASGLDVGALCVFDDAPRPPASKDQRSYLKALARQAANALEARGLAVRRPRR